MNYLLDTHILLWWLDQSPRLENSWVSLMEDPSHSIYVSSVSFWEISIKNRIGKLPLPFDPEQELEKIVNQCHFEMLPIFPRHALMAGNWQVAHRDPFDRMLAAQSKIEKIPLISNDPELKAFGVQIA
jgi:PIN domain nuclease of toxin-antitoxin system